VTRNGHIDSGVGTAACRPNPEGVGRLLGEYVVARRAQPLGL